MLLCSLLPVKQVLLLFPKLGCDTREVVVVAGVVLELLILEVDDVGGNSVEKRAIVRYNDDALLILDQKSLQFENMLH